MNLMDAIRAEVKEMEQPVSVPPSQEQMAHYYADTFDGGDVKELIELATPMVLDNVSERLGPVPLEVASAFLATFLMGMNLGVRAQKAAGAS